MHMKVSVWSDRSAQRVRRGQVGANLPPQALSAFDDKGRGDKDGVFEKRWRTELSS